MEPESDLTLPNYSFIPEVCTHLVNLLIVIVWLLESVWVWPKSDPIKRRLLVNYIRPIFHKRSHIEGEINFVISRFIFAKNFIHTLFVATT
jgi:hypothetical protein